jgi:hypothetical protein
VGHCQLRQSASQTAQEGEGGEYQGEKDDEHDLSYGDSWSQSAVVAQSGDRVGSVGHLQVDDRGPLAWHGNTEAEVIECGAQPFLEPEGAVEHSCRERARRLAQRGQNQTSEQQDDAGYGGWSRIECRSAQDVEQHKHGGECQREPDATADRGRGKGDPKATAHAVDASDDRLPGKSKVSGYGGRPRWQRRFG